MSKEEEQEEKKKKEGDWEEGERWKKKDEGRVQVGERGGERITINLLKWRYRGFNETSDSQKSMDEIKYDYVSIHFFYLLFYYIVIIIKEKVKGFLFSLQFYVCYTFYFFYQSR